MNNRGNSRNSRWTLIGIVVVVLLCALFGIAAVLRTHHEIDPSKLATVERGDLARSVIATGVIQPLAKVEVKSKASGMVKRVFADYGTVVKQGDILVELDKEQLQARVDEAHANLMAAQAGLESAEATSERNVVDAQSPEVPYLKATVERERKAAAEGLVAASVLDEAEKAFQLGLNKQLSARRNIAVSRAEVAKAKAQVAQSEAALASAEEDLHNSTIVSPMNGLVLSRDVEVGDAVSSILVLGSEATLIMTLGDVSSVYLLGRVDQADIGKVYLGQPARITVESFKEKKFQGRVAKISPMGVEKENVTTFEVRVSIQNPGGELKANMSANAEIILEEKHNVLLIPETAVVYDRDRRASVEVPDPELSTGRRKVPVQLGISNGIKTELISGLKEAQKVVLQ